ncbi:NADPH:quinone oxidoreductase family protein [Actinomadura rugatobispora]|uniref:NADPH:quinone oxidoreductase family protein n=1 Tax=Actinomadura rugatobispora TaxID=1994 RepID=A0ABW1A4P2_9ACTN|nr:NADPH:quinone oxidoreductase family protein [Actinomadura rugatobispora]
MRAVRVTRPDGPSAVTVADVPEPEPGTGVLIEVAAAGVSFPDLLMSKGRYQVQPDPPFTLGLEAAGRVLDAPAGSALRPGDRVAAFALGAFAERFVAPEESTFPLPDELTDEQGAGLIMNYQTAHFGLHRRGGLRAGEVVLVHGAAGGVGTAAIQVARGLGARVIGVVSTGEKAAVAARAGAHDVVLAGDWAAEVRKLTGGRGVDVVYDPVGGERTGESLRLLTQEGRLIVIGFADGAIPSLALNRVLLRNVSVIGAAWGHFVDTRPEVSRAIADDLARMAREGTVAPLVGPAFPLEDAAAALAALDDRRATGKVVLRTAR